MTGNGTSDGRHPHNFPPTPWHNLEHLPSRFLPCHAHAAFADGDTTTQTGDLPTTPNGTDRPTWAAASLDVGRSTDHQAKVSVARTLKATLIVKPQPGPNLNARSSPWPPMHNGSRRLQIANPTVNARETHNAQWPRWSCGRQGHHDQVSNCGAATAVIG